MGSNLLAIAVGGTLGCWGRYGLTALLQAVYGREFPVATLSVNVLGCFAMGFLFVVTLEHVSLAPGVRTGLLTGGLGGFTTFSTFAVETLLLFEEGEPARAVLYVLLSVVAGLAAALAGAYLARNF